MKLLLRISLFVILSAVLTVSVIYSAAPGSRPEFESAPEDEPQWSHPLDAEEILALDTTADDDDGENDGKTIDEIIFAAGTEVRCLRWLTRDCNPVLRNILNHSTSRYFHYALKMKSCQSWGLCIAKNLIFFSSR